MKEIRDRQKWNLGIDQNRKKFQTVNAKSEKLQKDQ